MQRTIHFWWHFLPLGRRYRAPGIQQPLALLCALAMVSGRVSRKPSRETPGAMAAPTIWLYVRWATPLFTPVSLQYNTAYAQDTTPFCQQWRCQGSSLHKNVLDGMVLECLSRERVCEVPLGKSLGVRHVYHHKLLCYLANQGLPTDEYLTIVLLSLETIWATYETFERWIRYASLCCSTVV